MARSATVPLARPDAFFIGGSWVAPSSDAKIDVIDAGTEEIAFSVAEAQAADMARAVEAARIAFSYYIATFNPAGLYEGTVTGIVIVVVWFYYAALIFILGGEVGQVYELRRVRKRQREVFSD